MDYSTIKQRSMSLNYSTEGAIRFSALTLLTLTGLRQKGWTFEWNNRKRALGLCIYSKKTIYLSKYLVKALKPHVRKDKVRQTLLHEIAHALTPGDNHGYRWQRVALALGSDGQRCAAENVIDTKKLDYKWRITCKGCGTKTHQNRLTEKRKQQYQENEMVCYKCGADKFKIKQLR